MSSQRRDRLVYFRVSEDEFQQMLNVCNERQARSVSELARNAVREFIRPGRTEREQEMLEAMSALQSVVHQIRESVQQLAGTQQPESLDTESAECSQEQRKSETAA